jgi:uncharacterized protein YbaP (TraB family)
MLKKISSLLLVLFYGIAVNAQNNNAVLWRINNPANLKGSAGGQPSYLFGTIHLPQEKFMQLSDSVYRAVINTNVFYGELNYQTIYEEMADNNDGFYTSKLAYIDSVQKTSSWRRMVASVNRNYHANIDPNNMEEFSKFGQNLLKEYMSAEPGVTGLDMALSNFAIVMGKKIKGLETFKFQMDMMYKIIDARLTDTTLLFNDELALVANMKRHYVSQHMDSMTPLIESMNINYRKIVFDNRNSSMADSIQNITTGNTAFFAVGCGHLLGKNGLISLLRSKGLQLTPVLSNNKLSITRMESFYGSFMKTMKKEFRKHSAAVDEELVPDERIEEIKDDIQIPKPPSPPPPLKKPNTKKPLSKTKNKKIVA